MKEPKGWTSGEQARRQLRRRAKRRRRWTVVGGIIAVGLAVSALYGWNQRAPARVNTQPKVNQTRTTLPQSANTANAQGQGNAISNHIARNATLPGPGSENAVQPSAMLNVPAQNQNPQLPNGCEVTSLSMLFTAIGHPVSKMTLAKEQPYDPTPRVKSDSGQIETWGNPNVGFVGSPYVWQDGFGIYHGPILKLINEILPGDGVNLTNQPFQNLLSYVAKGIPVEAWVTATLKPTDKFWVTWQSPEGPVHVTLQEHAVLIVGYDKTHIYINNPLNGDKQEAVKRSDFIAAWHQLGDQAVTVQTQSNR